MTGIFFIARLGSSRLEQKHLLKAGGKTFIEWLISRFEWRFRKEISSKEVQLVIVTADTPDNRKFEEVLEHLPVTVFYGDAENIPRRLAQAAECIQATTIISIDGDDILCSTEAACRVYDELKSEGALYVSTEGLPFGMNVTGYDSRFLAASSKTNQQEKLETGWGRIFDGEAKKILPYPSHSNKQLRFTLDYEVDAKFFESVITALGDRIIHISDEELIETVTRMGWYSINAEVNETYWENFNNQIIKEN